MNGNPNDRKKLKILNIFYVEQLFSKDNTTICSWSYITKSREVSNKGLIPRWFKEITEKVLNLRWVTQIAYYNPVAPDYSLTKISHKNSKREWIIIPSQHTL